MPASDHHGGRFAAAALVFEARAAGAGGIAGGFGGRGRVRIGFVRQNGGSGFGVGGVARRREEGEEGGFGVAVLYAVLVLLVVGPLVVGGVVLALELGFVAQELGEAGGFAVDGVEGEGLEGDGVGAGVEGGEFLDFAGEAGLLVEADAAEAPFGVGHFADLALFGEVVRGEVVGEFFEEGFVFGGTIAVQEDGLGTESVLKVVLGGAGLALGGARSSGVSGVGLVGGDLGSGSHRSSSVFRVRGGVKGFWVKRGRRR